MLTARPNPMVLAYTKAEILKPSSCIHRGEPMVVARDVVIAVRVRLHTATFFGYARLRTAGCEGDARLRTADHQCIPELFWERWCWWNLCLRAQCVAKDRLVSSGPTKKKVGTPPGQAPVTSIPSVSPPSSADVLAEYSLAEVLLLLLMSHIVIAVEMYPPGAVPHGCLSAVGPLMELRSASRFVLCSSFWLPHPCLLEGPQMGGNAT